MEEIADAMESAEKKAATIKEINEDSNKRMPCVLSAKSSSSAGTLLPGILDLL